MDQRKAFRLMGTKAYADGQKDVEVEYVSTFVCIVIGRVNRLAFELQYRLLSRVFRNGVSDSCTPGLVAGNGVDFCWVHEAACTWP